MTGKKKGKGASKRLTKHYTFTLPPAIAGTLKEVAKEEHRSASAQLAYMIEEYAKAKVERRG